MMLSYKLLYYVVYRHYLWCYYSFSFVLLLKTIFWFLNKKLFDIEKIKIEIPLMFHKFDENRWSWVLSLFHLGFFILTEWQRWVQELAWPLRTPHFFLITLCMTSPRHPALFDLHSVFYLTTHPYQRWYASSTLLPNPLSYRLPPAEWTMSPATYERWPRDAKTVRPIGILLNRFQHVIKIPTTSAGQHPAAGQIKTDKSGGPRTRQWGGSWARRVSGKWASDQTSRQLSAWVSKFRFDIHMLHACDHTYMIKYMNRHIHLYIHSHICIHVCKHI